MLVICIALKRPIKMRKHNDKVLKQQIQNDQKVTRNLNTLKAKKIWDLKELLK